MMDFPAALWDTLLSQNAFSMVLLALAVLVQGVYAYEIFFNRGGVPNVGTVPRMRRAIIEQLERDVQNHVGTRPYTVLDLGSGSGQLSWHIARALPEARVIGLETGLFGYARSVLRWRIFGPSNLEYRRTDFFSYNTAQADAVVMYLRRALMDRVGEKLKNELRPGAFVLSNMFALGAGWKPFETVDIKTVAPQKILYLYRKG